MGRERIGVMGGTLDPIHNGHLRMAQCALTEAALDRVLVLPSGNPPHKPHVTPGEDRWRMVCAACADIPGLEPCREELDRSGTIFTVDTLSILREKYPKAELFYLIGADTLMELKNWREYGRVLKLTRFLVCPRSSRYTMDELEIERERLKLLGGHISWLDMEVLDVSSTQIREAICQGLPAPHLPVPVQAYAEAAGLYGTTPRIPEAHAWLEKLFTALSARRFAHTLGVAATARRLALVHGLDMGRAEMAGLLHDCAKCLPLREMQRIARENGLTEDESLMESGALLHSLVGEHVARTEYGMEDPAVLAAIRRHTTGAPGMTRLDMAVWLADAIEPTRAPYPGLAELRIIAEVSLERAILTSMESTLAYVRKSGKAVHPATMETITWLRTLPECRR
ncbi:MAG: bis(5'-nucleosyl)-tetraphosphatase (symmetrical) YqeK [Clostridia bacterium]|nr:bis(5'-nucleosyl)-tetraphosphatase (symmetrical) YqeK [Clostridia bacterium]